MQPNRALLFTITVVILLCTTCGAWLRVQQQQYALNRQLIDALVHDDTKWALTLVNAGADPNTRQSPTPAPTLTQLLKQLLHCAPPSVNDSPTAFLMACGMYWANESSGSIRSTTVEENLPLLEAMLAHSADVNAREVDNQTALHHAVGDERLHTVELLLQHGADINAQSAQGQSPLMMAVLNRTPKEARLLLVQGANPNVQDTDGSTALHWAVPSSIAARILPGLLAHGAAPNLKNKNGDSPLHFAQKNNSPDLVALLKGGAGR